MPNFNFCLEEKVILVLICTCCIVSVILSKVCCRRRRVCRVYDYFIVVFKWMNAPPVDGRECHMSLP